MATLYMRTFNFKDSLSDAEVLEQWRLFMDDVIPAVKKVNGIRSIKVYSGAGALRADILVLFEMDDSAAYERLLVDSEVRKHLAKIYGAWDMKTASQSFRREVTSDLIKALSGS